MQRQLLSAIQPPCRQQTWLLLLCVRGRVDALLLLLLLLW